MGQEYVQNVRFYVHIRLVHAFLRICNNIVICLNTGT